MNAVGDAAQDHGDPDHARRDFPGGRAPDAQVEPADHAGDAEDDPAARDHWRPLPGDHRRRWV